MSSPAYYIHVSALETAESRAASRFRITPYRMLQILGYYQGDKHLEDLALEIIGEPIAPILTDSQSWNQEHQNDARQHYHLFHPNTTSIQPGLIVNGIHPWLSTKVDNLTWSQDGLGFNLYKSPYSKVLYRDPQPIHELQMTYTAAVLEWSRPLIDYVVWTPSGSALKHYTFDSILVSRVQMTLRKLWDDYLWPRLELFYHQILQLHMPPEQDQVLSCPSTEYVAITDPTMSAQDISSLFLA